MRTLPLHERRHRGQADAELAEILPAREDARRRRIHDAAVADVQAVQKRADDAHEEQHALAGAALIEVPQAGNQPRQERGQPRIFQIDLRARPASATSALVQSAVDGCVLGHRLTSF